MLRQVAISCVFVSLALPAAARTRPHYGGTLRVEIEGDAWAQRGTQQGGALSGGIAQRLVFDGLTRMDADGAPRPALAVRWASENNDHRWQFWLRPGVQFHDGSALTASAVESSLTGSCGHRLSLDSSSRCWLGCRLHRGFSHAQPSGTACQR